MDILSLFKLQIIVNISHKLGKNDQCLLFKNFSLGLNISALNNLKIKGIVKDL